MCLSPDLPVTNPPCSNGSRWDHVYWLDMGLEGLTSTVPAFGIAFSKNDTANT